MWQDPMPGLASDPLLLHDPGDGILIAGTKLESTRRTQALGAPAVLGGEDTEAEWERT